MDYGRRRPGPADPEAPLAGLRGIGASLAGRGPVAAPSRELRSAGSAGSDGFDDAEDGGDEPLEALLDPILDPSLDSSLDTGPDYPAEVAVDPDTVLTPYPDDGEPLEELFPEDDDVVEPLDEAHLELGGPAGRSVAPGASSGSAGPLPSGYARGPRDLGLDDPGPPDYDSEQEPLEILGELADGGGYGEAVGNAGRPGPGDHAGFTDVPSPVADSLTRASGRDPQGPLFDGDSPDDILRDMDEVLGSFEGAQGPAPRAARTAPLAARRGQAGSGPRGVYGAGPAPGPDYVPGAGRGPVMSPDPDSDPTAVGRGLASLTPPGQRPSDRAVPAAVSPPSASAPHSASVPPPSAVKDSPRGPAAGVPPMPLRPVPAEPAPARPAGQAPTVAYRPPVPARGVSAQTPETRTILLTDRVDHRMLSPGVPPPALNRASEGASIRSGYSASSAGRGAARRPAATRPSPASPAPYAPEGPADQGDTVGLELQADPGDLIGIADPLDSGEPLGLGDPSDPVDEAGLGRPAPSLGPYGPPDPPSVPPALGLEAEDVPAAGPGVRPPDGRSVRSKAADLTPEELYSLIERAVESGVARALARNAEGGEPDDLN
ncbi:MAG: hypothetical protein LBR80_07120 [Deltaproteobacteria bacterium]|jgi:hypothetical protein|nr:hypothetical protein [Deltaproteobacteria bacterium]